MAVEGLFLRLRQTARFLPCRAGLLWFSPKKQIEFKGDFDFPLENPLKTSRVATLHPGI